MKALNEIFARYSDSALLFLRLGVGIVFLVHGVGKLFGIGPFASGIAGFSGYLVNFGVPAALFFAWVVAIVETLGGIFVLIGLYTRASALLLAIDMIFAIALAHIPNGFYKSGGELALVLLLGSLALLFSGAGNKLKIID